MSHGTNVGADGEGVVTTQRLYQMIRQNGAITDHDFEIRCLDPGVQSYAFSFGQGRQIDLTACRRAT